MARLVLNCEGADLVTHELVRDFVMIGRTPSNHIVIDHPTVSAQHAVLLRVGVSYWLKDLNSMNGTQINGVLVTDAEVKDGDKIGFGPIVAVFAGRCHKRSNRGIRKFWNEYFF
jgi:FOG: FHA domain